MIRNALDFNIFFFSILRNLFPSPSEHLAILLTTHLFPFPFHLLLISFSVLEGILPQRLQRVWDLLWRLPKLEVPLAVVVSVLIFLRSVAVVFWCRRTHDGR